MYKRIFLIVMDSLGIGEAPDAKDYNDLGANTIGHIAEKMDLNIPNLEALGYGNIAPIRNVKRVEKPLAFYTKMMEASLGKDTMTGHWEMMGLYIDKPFQTFTDTGFPIELIKELEEKTGYKTIGNYSASGTEILVELGERHMQTKELIVYTSADSVLQIAMHEDIIPIEEQYRICEIAREITMKPEWKVGRVIARPFIGTDKTNFKRTPNRHDYALKPFAKTALNFLEEKGVDVIALGKINDIFDGYGITRFSKTVSNSDGMKQITEVAKEDFEGLVFLNLVDFDALYGHRRDPIGYGKAIEEMDRELPDLMKNLNEDDLLILTADHGNDPVHHGTDHTREYVPLIIYSKRFKEGKEINLRKTFADVGYSISENFEAELPENGKSFLKEIK
ncbi:phosphopentomutase [Haploplasma modicum]|uniref:phosphopentomutase n=1 Tax=Haploplasma modicum TaxID=2150 RepID=UPI0005584390|nr:phosphopentomutase [Haploplasma modicum]